MLDPKTLTPSFMNAIILLENAGRKESQLQPWGAKWRVYELVEQDGTSKVISAVGRTPVKAARNFLKIFPRRAYG